MLVLARAQGLPIHMVQVKGSVCLCHGLLRLNCCRNCLVGVDMGGRVCGDERIYLIFTFCFEHCIKEESFCQFL